MKADSKWMMKHVRKQVEDAVALILHEVERKVQCVEIQTRADTVKRERRRAVNILKESGHECKTCVAKILGRQKGENR